MNTLRASLRSLVALFALVPLAACVDPVIIGGNGGNGGNGGSGGNANACSADADCAAGQSCVNGQCTGGNPGTCGGQPSPVSCQQMGCPSGFVCTPDNDPNACHPSTCSCDATTNSWVCTADCQLGGSSCVPGVCQPGVEVCNGKDDDCDGAIDESNDPAMPLVCADGTICMNGKCGGGGMQCGPNGACPPNMFCDAAGMCVPVCAGTPEICNGIDDDCDGAIDESNDPANPNAPLVCADGTICMNGSCGGNTPCNSDADCAPGQVCQNGVCAGGPPPLCMTNADCPAGQVCQNGVCSLNIMCMTNADCPPNMICDPATAMCTAIGNCSGNKELCNGIDDNCNGMVDEAVPGTTLCNNGAMCVNGSCGGQIQCNPNSPCPAGLMCVNGFCK